MLNKSNGKTVLGEQKLAAAGAMYASAVALLLMPFAVPM